MNVKNSQWILSFIGCSFFLAPVSLAANEIPEIISIDFPDEAYAPPLEGALAYPWDKYVGYDDGFFIRTEDDGFSLSLNGALQLRYLYSATEDLNDYHRFEIRRAEIDFSGHFIDESWTYLLGTIAGTEKNFSIDDAYIAKAFNDATWGQAGYFTTPFLRERLISSTRQLTVERSLITKYFSTEKSTGILFGMENEKLKWVSSANNGYFKHDQFMQENGEPLPDHELQNGSSYGFVSRLEFKPLGNWQEFRDFNSPGGNATGLLIGIAGAYQRDNDIANIEEISSTVDVSFQGSGWSVFSMMAATKDHINDKATSYGAQLQSGVFVDEMRDKIELFSRYEWGHSPQQNSATTINSEALNVLTAGFNYYIYPVHLKLTTDFGYAFSSMGENWASENDGWRADPTSGQWVARTQLQMVI